MADVLETRQQAGATVATDLGRRRQGAGRPIERVGLSRSDQAAVGQLEDRITNLSRSSTPPMPASIISRRSRARSPISGLLERQPDGERGAVAPSPEVTSLRQNVLETQSSLESVQGALDQLINRLTLIENDVRGGSPEPDVQRHQPAAGPLPDRGAMASASPAPLPPHSARSASAAPSRAPAARAPALPAQQEHRPIDPNLPPDHPLEPGAMRGGAGNSPVDRIAASEAALGPVKPPVIPDPGNKANFIAAARRAAQAANSDTAARSDKPAPAANKATTQGMATGGWGNRVRSVLVAVTWC